MRLLLLQIAAFLLVPRLYAAERLLIMDVYVRIVPAGQIAPIPDPFIEAVVRGETPVMGEGIQALQGKSFQINPKFQDFTPLVAGVEGQKVSIQFTAAVLINGNCAVTQYRAMALAKTSKGQTSSVGSSETVSRAGFTVTPLHRGVTLHSPFLLSPEVAQLFIILSSRLRGALANRSTRKEGAR